MIKIINRYFQNRWIRFYTKNLWHLTLDLSLILVMIILAAALFTLRSYQPDFSWLSNMYTAPIIDSNNLPLELNFSVAEPTIRGKDGARLNLSFKNDGLFAINNLKIDFKSSDEDSSLVKLELVDNDARGLINNQTLILKKIAAGESGELELKAYFSVDDSSRRVLNWQAESEYFLAGKSIKATSTLSSLTLKADLTIKNVAYYTSPQGDQLGVGPLPPIVGLPTSYWIFWEAESEYDFKDLVFSARLPKGVELASGRSLLSGDFNYNSSSRQIIWKINDLEGNNDSYRLGFEVQLTPLISQVDQILPILNDFRYHAVDALTGEEKSGAVAPLDTDLKSDHFNSGQGRVIAQ